jgi:hypothetical protein
LGVKASTELGLARKSARSQLPAHRDYRNPSVVAKVEATSPWRTHLPADPRDSPIRRTYLESQTAIMFIQQGQHLAAADFSDDAQS